MFAIFSVWVKMGRVGKEGKGNSVNRKEFCYGNKRILVQAW